jgi:hypothetical protein
MENTLCPVCGSPFKYVPAGVSKKTGKPYQAFYACSKYGCHGKPPKFSSPTINPQQYTPQNANSEATAQMERVRIAFKTMQEEITYLKSENNILSGKVERLEKQFQGLYAVSVNQTNESAYELHSGLSQTRAIEDDEMIRIDDIPFGKLN